MPLNVFVSGTTGDFGQLRRELAAQLRQFRNLDIYPVVQEDLTEAGTLDGATVDRLIANVRNCSLVICLVGYDAGAPEISDRMKIQKIAEQRLENNFRKSHGDRGDLWHAWSDFGHGMTYTQLEFFLAASVFADQSRVRIILPARGSGVTDDDQAKAARTGQDAYLAFLREYRFWLDRIEFKTPDEVRQSVFTLAVEFALQQRDAAYGVSPHVGAREALVRSLTVLDNLNVRGQLTNNGYDAFYRATWTRLDDAIAVLDFRGDPLTIRGRRGPLLHLAGGGRHTLVATADDGAHAMSFGDDGGLLSHSVHPHVGEHEQPLSVSPGGELLLTWSPAQGHTMHVAQRESLRWPGPPDAPDPFSRRPAVGGTSENPWSMVWRGESCVRHEFATASTSQPVTPSDAFPVVEVIPLTTGVLEWPTADNAVPIRLPVAMPFASLSATCFVASQPVDDEDSLEGLRLCRIRRARVADLFLVAESDPLDGHVHEWAFRKVGRQLVLDITTIVADEKLVVHPLVLPGQPATAKVPVLPQDPLATDHDCKIQQPGSGDDSPRHRFPLPGRYLWSSDEDMLVHIEDAPPNNSRVRVWCFPRPMIPMAADRYIASLQQLLAGERELPETGGARTAWQRTLVELM